ncbi:hypothetical protein D3C75_739300 [compost metagenome]
MLLGEVEEALADAAFGLDHQLVAHAGTGSYYFAEHLFSFAGGINIRMIKKVYSGLQGAVNMHICFLRGKIGNTHTS